MDVSEIKELLHSGGLVVLFMLGVIIFIPLFMAAIDTFALFLMVFITGLSKCFWGSEEVVDEITTTTTSNSRRRLNLLEIISHIFWFRVITETGRCFLWAIIPTEFQPNLKAYLQGKHKGGKYTWSRRTPFVFKYLLNNPSETAADFAEAFTTRILANVGFHHFPSSSSDGNGNDNDNGNGNYNDNYNYNYQGCYDSRVYFFEQALSKSCFARELIERYNSIDWDNAGVSPPPPPTSFTGLEKRILRFYFAPEDNEWIEPFNNWFKWYTKTIHERIFPSQDYQVFEATVQFLFFSFLHDLVAPFISWFALFGITTL